MLNYEDDEEFLELLHQYEQFHSDSYPYFDAGDMYDIIDYYMFTDRRDKAQEALQFALRLHPQDSDLRLIKARMYAFFGKPDAALKILRSLPPEYRKDPDAVEAVALSYSMKGEVEQAVDAINGVLDDDTYNTHLWAVLGDIYHDHQQWDKAIDAYENVRAIDPSDYSCNRNLADAYVEKGCDDVAEGLYRDELGRLEQNRESYLHTYGEEWLRDEIINILYNLIDIAEARKDYAGAIALVERVIALVPDAPKVLIRKGHFLLHLQNIDEAEQTFANALHQWTDSDSGDEALLLIATSYIDCGYPYAGLGLLDMMRCSETLPLGTVDALIAFCKWAYDMRGWKDDLAAVWKQDPEAVCRIFGIGKLPDEASVKDVLFALKQAGTEEADFSSDVLSDDDLRTFNLFNYNDGIDAAGPDSLDGWDDAEPDDLYDGEGIN